MSHARFAPSAAERWLRCPGSIALAESLPEGQQITGDDSEYAREGTRAHAIAAQALLFALDGHDYLYAEDVPEEMQAAVALYVSTVLKAMRKGDEVLVEKRFAIDDDLWGTADAVVLHNDVHTAEVFDLKYGEGVVVEATDNPQGGIYLAAVGKETTYRPERFTIIQPRAGHKEGPVRSWAPHPAELRNLLWRAKGAIAKGKGQQPPLAAGEWCQFCPAKGHCPELSKHAQLIAAEEFEVLQTNEPGRISNLIAALPIEALVAGLAKAPIIELWFKAARDRIAKDLLEGRSVPGWKLVAKKPRRQWTDPEVVALWAELSGIGEDAYERALKSPAQLEIVIGKKNLPPELYTMESSGATIAPVTDSRPALASAAGEDFPALPPGSDAGEQVN